MVVVHIRLFLYTSYRLAREVGLEYVEIQNLTEFYEDNRYASEKARDVPHNHIKLIF